MDELGGSRHHLSPGRRSALHGHELIVKTPHGEPLAAEHRLALSRFLDAAPATGVDEYSLARSCGRASKVGKRFFDTFHIDWAKSSTEGGSASASVVIAAVLKLAGGGGSGGSGGPVFIKMTFGSSKTSMLQVERLIYCRVVTPLVRLGLTPCVVPYLGYVKLKRDLLSTLCLTGNTPTASAANTQENVLCRAVRALMRDEGPKFTVANAHLLITEKAGGTTLAQFMRTGLRQQTMEDVWFQIVYTLRVFAMVGLCHGDLHIGNLFVEEGDGDDDLATVWCLGENRYRLMRSPYLVKIYDFDHAAKVRSPVRGFETAIDNPGRSRLKRQFYGSSAAIFDPRCDYLRVATSVWKRRSVLPQQFTSALGETYNDVAVDDSVRRHEMIYPGFACYRTSCVNECTTNPRKTARFCTTPADMLERGDERLLGKTTSTLAEAIAFLHRHASPASSVFALPSGAAQTARRRLVAAGAAAAPPPSKRSRR